MACACKTNQDIAFLQKTYGMNHQEGSKKTNIRGSVDIFFKKLVSKIVVVLLSPVMLILVITQLFGKKVIKIEELFGLKNVNK